MKINNKQSGFTLIELLAVIVILAIVLVLASSSVLPFMNNAQKDTFAIEANGVLSAAENAMTLNMIGQLDFVPDGTNLKQYTNGEVCFTIKYLVDNGLLDIKSEKINDNNYAGFVRVTKNGLKYSYKLSFKNSDYYIMNGLKSTYTKDDAHELDATGKNIKTVCPST